MDSTNFALFNRKYSISIGPQGETGNVYDKVRLTFEIEKTSDPNPNKAKIEIYNLSQKSRALFKSGDFVIVNAGYKDFTDVLYIGEIVSPGGIKSKRSGSEIVTTFECGDSERQLIGAHFNQSYGAGTTVYQVINDVAKALGVSVGPIIGINDEVYNKGVSFSGACSKILETICNRPGQQLEFSVQNGVLQILPITQSLNNQAIVLSSTTGLIGIPAPKEQGSVEFNALLNPKIQPGVLVQIISENINGFYKIRKAKFEGDTHGDKWNVICEGVEQPNVAVAQNASNSNDFVRA